MDQPPLTAEWRAAGRSRGADAIDRLALNCCTQIDGYGTSSRAPELAAVSDEIFMRRALELAEEGMRRGEMPIGAIAVVDGEVVGEAHTEERSQNRLLVHADLLALDAADRRIGGRRRRTKLYVTLEPCLMCLGAAFAMRIGEVVYALESPSDGGCSTFTDWDRQRRAESMPGYAAPSVRGGVLRRDSAALFATYASTAPPGWTRDWAAELAALGRASI